MKASASVIVIVGDNLTAIAIPATAMIAETIADRATAIVHAIAIAIVIPNDTTIATATAIAVATEYKLRVSSLGDFIFS